ncbi:MAG: hypothetical protein ABSD71_14285 [Bacteroidales bacterium]|jgi:hypothetical protein
MTTSELFNLLAEDLVLKINNSKGLSQFVHRRAKFEGWLKVEIIDTLVRKNINALPEIDRIDVSFDKVGIELKTINTNIRFKNVNQATRPITKNTESVIKDIEKLKSLDIHDKFVVFVVFPIEHLNPYWQTQLQRIISKLTEIKLKEFHFLSKVPGVIYIGRV